MAGQQWCNDTLYYDTNHDTQDTIHYNSSRYINTHTLPMNSLDSHTLTGTFLLFLWNQLLFLYLTDDVQWYQSITVSSQCNYRDSWCIDINGQANSSSLFLKGFSGNTRLLLRLLRSTVGKKSNCSTLIEASKLHCTSVAVVYKDRNKQEERNSLSQWATTNLRKYKMLLMVYVKCIGYILNLDNLIVHFACFTT